jgi:cytochrome c oxidase cbb3-type subunit I/II
VREGCYTCHSQMVRPFRSETERYGEYSKAGEFVYDHPFQWGSKRTGPDLHRVGGKYPDSWHYYHMFDPGSMSPGSLMPAYPALFEDVLDTSTTRRKIEAMITLGVPYPADLPAKANQDVEAQSARIVAELKKGGIEALADREIIAMIAYLQRVGTDIKGTAGATADKIH